jgi:predicted TPR repeat methyltransferase
MSPSRTVTRLIGPPEADGEYIVLRTDASEEEIVHLHDYERIYDVAWLYEHVVQDLLGCRSPQTAVDGLARAFTRLGIDPAGVVLLDLGAGTGIVGGLARELGIRTLIGVDSLEAARAACLRDRTGVYDDYLVGDLAAPSPGLLERLRRHRPTAFISAGAFGGTHGPPAALLSALGLLPTHAPVVFTIDEKWMQTDDRRGFRTAVNHLLASGQLRLLERSRFQHRVSTAGEPIHYELVVAAAQPPISACSAVSVPSTGWRSIAGE